MKRISLAWQIIIGLIAGIIVGAVFYKSEAVVSYLQPIGDIFIHLIKMIVIPIVISSLIVGVAGVGDNKKLGRLGLKTIIYFEIITTVALVVGLLLANVFQPGTGVDMDSLSKGDLSSYMDTANAEKKEDHGFISILVSIVPQNVFQSIVEGKMLPIIFFSVLFGLGVAAIGERGKPVVSFFQGVADTMFYVTNQVMKVAPLGVFALIGVTVSKFGLKSLIPLSKLTIVVYGAMILFVFVVLGLVARLAKVKLMDILRILKSELLLAYSTASSETVLPRMMEKMERFGCPKGITSFVIPTGYTFNLDGSTLYQSIAVVFIAQMYGIDLSIGKQLTILLILMVTSKGMAAVPGASVVVLLATLSSVGLPLEGMAFVLGIDRILDMARTAVNVVGNSLAAIVMSKWEGEYDENQGKNYINELRASSEAA
ncbi:cation:dicarboxylate symporter family transporter [Marininema halotolerans]|uniref:Proton glutamate symport protein n=1 Tax=Marininema halotolerans TaxID=1155944 RepID=A0A1I6RKY9_9BACL|nr:cation:dicarboxylase symporter family transporter [Marininema halotolerans]SFS65399.1 proton glutamate symport protein [Marininema halotolerans]